MIESNGQRAFVPFESEATKLSQQLVEHVASLLPHDEARGGHAYDWYRSLTSTERQRFGQFLTDVTLTAYQEGYAKAQGEAVVSGVEQFLKDQEA